MDFDFPRLSFGGVQWTIELYAWRGAFFWRGREKTNSTKVASKRAILNSNECFSWGGMRFSRGYLGLLEEGYYVFGDALNTVPNIAHAEF